MADQLHLVPIRMDALYLDQDALMAEPSVDFARLPFFNGQRDVNPDVANISENFVAPPLQNQNQLYPKGLHLHWALPDTLTRGKRIQAEERSTVEFPTVPDRWLIQRTGGNLPTKQWVVESNFLWPEEIQLSQIIQAERQINQYQQNTLFKIHQFLEEVWGTGRSLIIYAEKQGLTLVDGFETLVNDLEELAAYVAKDGLPPDENENPKLLQSVQTERESLARMDQFALLLEQSQPTEAELLRDFINPIRSTLTAATITDSEITDLRTGLMAASQEVDAIKQNFVLFKEAELYPFAETLGQIKAELAVVVVSAADGHQELLDDTLLLMDEIHQSLGAPALAVTPQALAATTSLSTIQLSIGDYLDQHRAASAIFEPLSDFLSLPSNDQDVSQEDLQILHDGLNEVHVLIALVYGYLPFFQADLQSQLETQYIQLDILHQRLSEKKAELATFAGEDSGDGDASNEADDDEADDATATDFTGLINAKQAELDAKIIERDGDDTVDPPISGLVAEIATKQGELDSAEQELILLEQELTRQQEELAEKERQKGNFESDQTELGLATEPTGKTIAGIEEELNGADGESGKNKELADQEAELEGKEKQLEDTDQELSDLSRSITELEASVAVTDENPGTITDIMVRKIAEANQTATFDTATANGDADASAQGQAAFDTAEANAKDKLKAFYDLLAGTPQGAGSLTDLVMLERELEQWNLDFQTTGVDPLADDDSRSVEDINSDIEEKNLEIQGLEDDFLALAVENTSVVDYINSVFAGWQDTTRSIIELKLEEAALEIQKASLEGEVGVAEVVENGAVTVPATGLHAAVGTLSAEVDVLNKEMEWLHLQGSIDALISEIAVLQSVDGTTGTIVDQQLLVDDKTADIEGGTKSDSTTVTGFINELETMDGALELLEGDINALERELEQLQNEEAAAANNSGSSSQSSTAADLELQLEQDIDELEQAIVFKEKTISQAAGSSFEDYANKRKYSITMPVEDAWQSSGQQAFRYMGRSLTLAQYLNRPQVGQEFYQSLTALGYGEPSFAAFYPNCRSVFGFHDPEINSDISTAVQYVAVGWYSQLGQDYLQQLLAGVDNPLYQLAYEGRWLHPVTITFSTFSSLLPDASEARDIWNLLVDNNWLNDPDATDEAIILVQDSMPEFPEEILTRPALVKEALQGHLANQTPADFPQEMICAAQLEFQPFATDEFLNLADFSARLGAILSERGDTVSNLEESVNLIWQELDAAHWIEIDTDTTIGRLVDPKDRVPRFLDLDVTEPISQAMVEEALRAEPQTAISVTVANTNREAIAARLAHDVAPLNTTDVRELRLLEAEIQDLEAQIDSLRRREEKIGLTAAEQTSLSTFSDQLDNKRSARDDLQEELDTEEASQRPVRLEAEDQLEALFLTDQITDQQLDTGPKFAEARHEAGFNASSGGGQWMVRLEREGEQNAQEITEAERNRVTLPETVATALCLLNDAQTEYDHAQFLIDSQRQQLFTDWYKYMMSTYPPQDSLVDFPDIDELRYFIQEKDLRPLWDLLTATGQVLLDDPTQPYTASSALGLDRDEQLINALLREIDALDTTPEESVRDLLIDFTDRRELLSFLAPTEITDWEGLISLLQNPGESTSTQQVFDSLPTDIQIIVRTADPAAPTDEDKSLIVQGLVDILMQATQVADALNLLQLDLRAENIGLSLLEQDDIKDWASFFNALTSPPSGSVLEVLRQSLSPSIQDQIDAQHLVRWQVIEVFNAILSTPEDKGRLTAVLDSLRQFGQSNLILLQFAESHFEDWTDIFADIQGRSAGSAVESLYNQLSSNLQSTIDAATKPEDLAANELARLGVLKGLRKMLWQQSSVQAVHALNLLMQWLTADLLLDNLESADIRDWAGLLYELKYGQANAEIADLWTALPADLQTLLTDNEVEEVLIDEDEKIQIVEGINNQLKVLDFRPPDQQAEDSYPEEIVAANRTILEGELGAALRPSLKGKYRLQRQSSPRYWTPKEPSVLITGDLATHSERFGKDGQSHHGLLECHLLVSAAVESLLNQEDDLQNLLTAITNIDAPQWSVAGQANPWNPFLLEWEIEACPIQYGGNSRDQDYTAKYILDNTELGVNQVDLRTTTDQFLEGNNPDIYNGRSLLTTQSATIQDMENRLQAYLANDTADDAVKARIQAASDSLAGLKGQMLGQALSGFNPAMLMLRQSYQMPVMDPIGFREYQDFTYLVNRLVGIATKQSPQPLTDFNPIRTGKLRVNQLRLIDSFGQYRQLDLYGSRHGAQLLGSSLGATQVDGLDNRAMIDLTPRITQASRLSFRWLAAESLVQEEADSEMNNLPDSSPVCGWVMANHLDGSLMIFDANGRSLGAIENEDDGDWAKWTPAPGLEGVEDSEDIANDHLRKMATYLRTRQAVFMEQFLENTHKVLQSIEPETFAQQQALALLMGRPMALVRASIDLDLYGVPAVNHSWEAFYRDRLDNDQSRETDQYTQIRFPIRLGAVSQLNDGLVGYWVEDELGRYENDLFYINLLKVDANTTDLEVWMLPDDTVLDEHFSLLDDSFTPITQSLSTEEPAVKVSMLVDPRARVHAFSGILPAKNISIPSEHYLAALQAIDITFLTAPVLTTAEKIQVPLTDQPGFAWSWLEQLSPDNWREVHTFPTLRKDLFVDTFTQQVWAYLRQRKWIADSGSDFVMRMREERNPLSRNFESLQIKIDLAFPTPPDTVDAPAVLVSMTDDLRPLIVDIWENVLINPGTQWLRGELADDVGAIVPMEERLQTELVVLDPNDGSTILHDYRGLETRVEELFVRLQTSVQDPVTDAQFYSEQLWLREGWLQLKRVE